MPGELPVAPFAATETVARALALEAEIVEVQVADDFERALEAARIKHVDAGILLSSPLVFVASKQIGELALAKRLPLISLFAEFPKSGGLIAYGPNLAEIFRRCGEYVGKVLHGANPSDLPIQRPEAGRPNDEAGCIAANIVPKLNELRDKSLGWWVEAADAELVAVQVTEGEFADETCGLFGDLSGAFGCSQSCSRTGDWQSTRGPHISTTGLFRVSRDPKRTGSLAKLTGTDIPRACHRSWNDDRCPIRGAYDAACGDANVQVYDRTKRRCYRLYHLHNGLNRGFLR